jgi:predicted NAD/FAD-dependent oxidoreductase
MREVTEWEHEGAAARWLGRIVELDRGRVTFKKDRPARYVGLPGMSAIARRLAGTNQVRCGVRITQVLLDGRRWHLVSDDGSSHGPFGALVVAVPAPQSKPLLASSPHLAMQADQTQWRACWAVMLSLPTEMCLPFDGAFVNNSPLSWVARDSSKPERPGDGCWVLHAGPEWSQAQIKAQPKAVIAALCEAFESATGCGHLQPAFAAAHLWRYALPIQPIESDCLFDADLGLGACGDWCGGPRIEGAYLSGLAAAERMLEYFGGRIIA